MTHEEQQQQTALFNWAAIMEHQIPELALLYHIPNEGKRSKVSGAVLKSMGLKKGIPDVCLPVPRGGYGALYVEMKAEHGVVSREQKAMMAALEEGGNRCVVCRSWTDAKEEIEKYLAEPRLPLYEREVVREPYPGWVCEQYGGYVEIGEKGGDVNKWKEACVDELKEYMFEAQIMPVVTKLAKENVEYYAKDWRSVENPKTCGVFGWKMPFLVRKEEIK